MNKKVRIQQGWHSKKEARGTGWYQTIIHQKRRTAQIEARPQASIDRNVRGCR